MPRGMCFLLSLSYWDGNTIWFGSLNMYIGLDTVIYLYVEGVSCKNNIFFLLSILKIIFET